MTNKIRRKSPTTARSIARDNNEMCYVGRTCKRCGGTLRYVVSSNCADLKCRRGYEKLYREKDPQAIKIRNRKRKMGYYGLTCEDYDAIMLKQVGVCAICKERCITGKELAIDHDHSTNVVRGLLCNKCNQGIGFFNDNIHLLTEAINYLNESSNNN